MLVATQRQPAWSATMAPWVVDLTGHGGGVDAFQLYHALRKIRHLCTQCVLLPVYSTRTCVLPRACVVSLSKLDTPIARPASSPLPPPRCSSPVAYANGSRPHQRARHALESRLHCVHTTTNALPCGYFCGLIGRLLRQGGETPARACPRPPPREGSRRGRRPSLTAQVRPSALGPRTAEPLPTNNCTSSPHTGRSTNVDPPTHPHLPWISKGRLGAGGGCMLLRTYARGTGIREYGRAHHKFHNPRCFSTPPSSSIRYGTVHYCSTATVKGTRI